MDFRRKLNIQKILLMVIQVLLVVFWFLQLNKHELISKEGYQYSKYNGIYFLCGFLAVIAMGDRLFSGRRLTGKQGLWTGVLGLIYGLATVLANYPAFEPFGQNLPRFFAALAGGTLVGGHILAWGLRRLPLVRVTGEKRRGHGGRFYLAVFGSIAAVYLLHFFFAAYPGYFSRDSFAAINQCMTGTYDNSSPFWHTMLVKLCLEIGSALGGRGNSAVCVYGIVQSLMMAAVFAYALMTLYQAGIPKWCIGVVYCMYTFLSYNLAFSATMWKDIPFSIGALLIVVSAYRLLKGIGRQGLNEAVFALGGLFFCLMRTNGWYSYLAMAAVMVLILRSYSRRLLVILCAVLAAGWICNNPVLDALEVSETDFVEAMAIPFQQVARVVYDECEVSQEDMEMIGEIFYLDRLKELYDPLTVDPVKFEAFRHDRRDYLRENLASYVGLWLRLGWQHPWTYAKAWIDETQGYWNAGYHYWIYPRGESEEHGIIRPEMDNPVAHGFDRLFHFLESTPPITQPLYGIGFQVWILLFCFIICAMQKREEFLLSIPIVVIVVGLWLGTPVFAEFRYAYPVFVTAPVLLCTTVFGLEK